MWTASSPKSSSSKARVAAGFEVSAASACSSGSMDASHVLTAMGIPRERALGSLRISFDDRVDPADLDRFADALLKIAG